MIARGGRGGRGNRRFTTAVRQAPRTAEVGEDGESAELELRLKMVCDAALLGFPNAGKSSLLRRISNATPKVADYPFTTLAPQLGTVELDGQRQLTVADVPGLLEGASDGVGLGHAFLAHLERAHALVHVVAIDPEAGDPLRGLPPALCRHPRRAGRPRRRPRRAAADRRAQQARPASTTPKARRSSRAFAEAVVAPASCRPTPSSRATSTRRRYVLGLSCATGAGVASLRGALERVLGDARVAEPAGAGEEELADYLLYRPQARQRLFRLVRDDGIVRIAGREVVSLVDKLDLSTPAGVRALSHRAGPPGRDRRAPPRGRQAGPRGRDRRRALRVLAAARGSGRATAAPPTRTEWTTSGEHRHPARRRARIALQPRPPRAPAALPGGDLAARPLQGRARADRDCRRTARRPRSRRRCDCASLRRRRSATRR